MPITPAAKLRRVASMVNNKSKNQKHFVELEVSIPSPMVMAIVAISLLVFVGLIHTRKRGLAVPDLLE